MAFLCKINQKLFSKIFPLVINTWSHVNISWSFWNISKILVGRLVFLGIFCLVAKLVVFGKFLVVFEFSNLATLHALHRSEHTRLFKT